MSTSPPRFARSTATALPSPRLAPVTRHTLPSRRTFSGRGLSVARWEKRSTTPLAKALNFLL